MLVRSSRTGGSGAPVPLRPHPPSQRVLENYPPPAGVEVFDEHQALLRVAEDSATRVEILHGETCRRFSQKLVHLCHGHPAAGRLVCHPGVALSGRDPPLQRFAPVYVCPPQDRSFHNTHESTVKLEVFTKNKISGLI